MYAYCENSVTNCADYSGYYVVSAITISQFYNKTWSNCREIKRKIYGNRPLFAVWTVKSKGQFIYAWNHSMGNTDYLIIDMHGWPGGLGDNKSFVIENSDIAKLKYKKVKCLILLGCDNGDALSAGSNIAFEFVKRISGIVVAGNGTVHWKHYGINNQYGDLQYYYSVTPTTQQYKAYGADWVVYYHSGKKYRQGGINFNSQYITLTRLIDNLKRFKFL